MAETSVADDRTEQEVLSVAEYDQLLAATTTYRERLLVRLGGEVGLRATEMTTIRPSDVARVQNDPDRFFLSVPERDTERREAYLPPTIEEELRRYIASDGIGDTDRIFGVTPRRVQMLVRSVGDRTAERTGNERFERVSVQDLRGYFARTLLCDREISPRIVRSIGGWGSFEALSPYLDPPTTEEIVTALGKRPENPRSVALDSVLIDASTREELETAVCEALAERYRFAWIEAPELGETRTPNAASGIDEESIRSLRSEQGPGRTRTDRGSIVESSIRYGETRYGTLYVGVGRPIREETREEISVVGRRIGHAITAIRRQKLLLADTILELEFYTADSQSVFVAATAQFDCRFDLESIVSASESTLLYYVTLSGASAPDVLEFAGTRSGVEDSRLVEGRDSGALIEFAISGSCPLLLLTDYGATVREMTAENGEARIFADCAYDTDLRALVDRVTSAFPDTRFVGKQATERGANTPDGFTQGAIDRLTERQRAALQAAYFGGYFDWPRGSTAEEIADAMGVSSPTLHSHLRKGQRELLELLFEEE